MASDVPRDLATAGRVTHQSDVVEVECLDEGGADDYLLEPFSAREIVARMRAPRPRGEARDQARAMGGELRVRSREGNGSAFTLTLPAG